MSRKVHVAVGSTMSKPGDINGNLKQITTLMERAAHDDVDVLLTPELSASGYGPYPEVLATAERAGGGTIYSELAAASEATGVTVCAGFAESTDERTYLSHYAILPDGTYTVQRKHRVTLAERPFAPSVELIPPDYENDPPDDPADPGQPTTTDFPLFTVKGVQFAITICADGGIDGVLETLVSQGAEFILGPSGAGGKREDRVTNVDLVTDAGRERYTELLESVFFPGVRIADCIKHRIGFAAVNLCGFDGVEKYHLGHGSIINAMGEVPALIHGLPNLDRQRVMYTHALVDLDECLPC